MKKLISLLVVLAMLMAIAPAAFAEDAAVGSVTNPAELVLGENVAEVAANPDQLGEKGYYFTWTATEAGTLTIDFSDDDEGTPFTIIYVYNEYGAFTGAYAEISSKGGSGSVAVEPGNVVAFGVEEWDYLAATLHFTATFEAVGGVAGSGTENDPWIVETLPTALEGTFPEDLAADENWMGYYYQFVATEAGTISFDSWTGCGLFVTVNGDWTDADAVTVAADDVVLINVWANMGACDYSVELGFEVATEDGGETEEDVVLNRGDNAFEIPGGSYYGGIYTAHAAGTLTITVTEFMIYDEEAGDYVAVEDPATFFSRMGYYDLLVNDEDANACTYTIEVEAGQEVAIYISSRGSDAMAGVNLYLEPAEEDDGGEENNTPSSGTVDVTADAPIVYDLVLDADATVTITLTSTTGWEVHIGNATGDVDNRYWSDAGGSPVVEELAAGAYTITIWGYDEPSWDYVDATITYDISVAAGEEETPACPHDEEGYPEIDYCYDDPNLCDYVGWCGVCGAEVIRKGPGTTIYNWIGVEPVMNEDGTVATMTITVPAGQSLYYGHKDIHGFGYVYVNGEFLCELDSIGNMFGNPSGGFFQLSNDTDADVTYEVLISVEEYEFDNEGGEVVPPVVDENQLVLGENNLAVSGGEEWTENTEAEFTYVAEQAGTLYFSIRAFIMYGENKIDFLFDPAYNVMDYYCAIYINGTMVEGIDTSVEVAQGDVVTVKLTSIDGGTYEIKLNMSYDGFYVPAPGSEEAPLDLHYADCSTEKYPVEIGAGEEIWYFLDYMDYEAYDYGPFAGATLLVYGENAYVDMVIEDRIMGGSYTIRYEAENGVVTVPIEGEVIVVGNAGDAAATFELFAYIPLGSERNPDQLILGDNNLDLEENADEYFYSWIAEETGRLTVTITGDDNWGFTVSNMTTEKYGDSLYQCVGDENTWTVEVNPGDEIQVRVWTLDADHKFPAGSYVITASFNSGFVYSPIGLGDNEMVDGRYQYVAEQTGTLYFCVTSLGYMSWSGAPIDATDDIRTSYNSDYVLWVNDEVVDEFCGFVEVTAGDVVTIRWENFYGDYYGTLNLSYENNNPALGSEERPVGLAYEDCPTTTIEIAPGAMAWYELDTYSFYDAVLTIKGENVAVQYEYYDDNYNLCTAVVEAENGQIVLTEIPRAMLILNNGTEAAVFEIEAYIPEGTSGNPADLVLGDNVQSFEENAPSYYYEWYAPANGTLTLTVSGDSWYMYAYNETTGESTNLFFYSDPCVDAWTIQVTAGDHILIDVATCLNYDEIDWSQVDFNNPPVPPAGTVCVNASFTCTEHGETYIDMDFCYPENEMLYDLVERCVHCHAEMARYLPGTEFNPLNTEFVMNETGTVGTATVTVPVGTTYFAAYHVGGMLLTITDSEGNVISTQVLPDVWGRMPVTFAITNEGEAEVTYTLSVSYPVGHMMNPDAIVEGETVLDLAEGNTGYYYEWVAEKDGVLTVMVSGDNWMLSVGNLTSGVYGDYLYSDADPVVSKYSVEVKAGDVVQVFTTTFDPNYGPNPAGQIALTLIFEADSAGTGDASIFVALASVLVSGMSVIALPKKKEN